NRLCKTLQDLIGDPAQFEYVAHQGAGRRVNQYCARLGSALQPGSQVGRLAGYRLGVEATAAYQITDDDLAGRDADPGPQVLAVAVFDLGYRCNGLKASTHRALALVLVCLWPTEIGEHAIAEEFRAVSVIARDDSSDGIVISSKYFPQIFRIQ